MGAACVCMLDDRWRCGEHGAISPAMRQAARYGRDVGEAKRLEQEQLAEATHACCGEARELGHHPQCANWQEPVEVHPDQGALL